MRTHLGKHLRECDQRLHAGLPRLAPHLFDRRVTGEQPSIAAVGPGTGRDRLSRDGVEPHDGPHDPGPGSIGTQVQHARFFDERNGGAPHGYCCVCTGRSTHADVLQRGINRCHRTGCSPVRRVDGSHLPRQ